MYESNEVSTFKMAVICWFIFWPIVASVMARNRKIGRGISALLAFFVGPFACLPLLAIRIPEEEEEEEEELEEVEPVQVAD